MSDLTIQWGDTMFVNLAPMTDWAGPGGAGLFVVMVQPDPTNAPGDYRALFFGESENLASADFFRAHPKFRCCVSEAERVDLLWFAASPLEGSPIERKQKVRVLADQFHPICNW